MSSRADPIIDSWYHYPEKAQKFRVNAIDEHTDTVEIQYFDGTLDEIEMTEWYAFDIELIEEPEDWTGPIDNIERDDLNPVGTEMQREDWDAPYEEEDEKLRAGPRFAEEEPEEEPEEELWEEDIKD